MRPMLWFIISSLLIIAVFVAYIGYASSFSKENYISIIGYYSILSSAIILYLQLRVNLRYNRRKAAIDFSNEKISKELFPILRQITPIVGKEFILFSKEKTFKEFINSLREEDENKEKIKQLVLDIVNFYERMSIGIIKEVYDEDICYDDNGYHMVHFYAWTKGFISEMKEKHGPRIFINFQYLAENWQNRLSRENAMQDSVLRKSYKKGTIQNPNI